MIVGVTGYAKHGKGEVGRRLVEAHGYTEFQFSAALKEMALRLSPYVPNYVRSDGHWESLPRLADIVERDGWDEAKRSPEVRRILQVLGTECARDIIGEDSWIHALERAPVTGAATPRAVITDLRFPNEADWVHRNGGVVVRITRYVPCSNWHGGAAGPHAHPFDNGIGADHPSEKFIAELDADYDIRNDGTLRDLDAEVDAVARDIRTDALIACTTEDGPHSPYEDIPRDDGHDPNIPSGARIAWKGREAYSGKPIERPGDHVARTLADCE